MEDEAYQPDDEGAPTDTAQRDQREACQFCPGCSLLLPEGPILIQEKAVNCAQAIGECIICQQHECAGGREEPQQAIQDHYINQGIQSAGQSKSQHLPGQVEAARGLVYLLMVYVWLVGGRRSRMRLSATSSLWYTTVSIKMLFLSNKQCYEQGVAAIRPHLRFSQVMRSRANTAYPL